MVKKTSQQKLQQAWGRKTLNSMLFPRMPKKQQRRRRLAHHEAGHAVAYAICGFEIAYVTILEETDAAGVCQAKGRQGDGRAWGTWFDPEHVWISLAGIVAEARFLKCGVFCINPETWDTDWCMARERVAGRLGRQDAEEWEDAEMDAEIDQAFHETRRLIAENWIYVERVALALLDRDRLDGDEVLCLCDRLSIIEPPAILAQKMRQKCTTF